jgi:hypothetical protein
LAPSLFALCNISSSLFCTNSSIFCSNLDFVFHKYLPKFCNSNESKCHFCEPAGFKVVSSVLALFQVTGMASHSQQLIVKCFMPAACSLETRGEEL